MKPVSVQVITYAPTMFSHCQHCELTFREMGIGEQNRQREAAEALPDDLVREFQDVSDWVHALLQRHGSRVRVDLLDAASIRGVLATLRHRIRSYPAVVIDGHETLTGLGFDRVDEVVDRTVAEARAGLTTKAV